MTAQHEWERRNEIRKEMHAKTAQLPKVDSDGFPYITPDPVETVEVVEVVAAPEPEVLLSAPQGPLGVGLDAEPDDAEPTFSEKNASLAHIARKGVSYRDALKAARLDARLDREVAEARAGARPPL